MHKSHYRWLIRVGALAGLIAIVAWAWVPEKISNPNCRYENNAAWISVDWISTPMSSVNIQWLAESASNRKLRYLFAYASYLKADGTFNPTYDHATEFVTEFRRFNPDTKLLAWIGLPLKNSNFGGIAGWVDLDNKQTRIQIAEFVADLIEEAQFDGVHLDAETVLNHNQSYLLLLEEVKAALGPQRLLSVAGSHWLPEALNSLPLVNRTRWTDSYYQAVAERADQIAPMTYDSFSSTGAFYRLWMREQARGISQSLADSNVELLMGVSVARENTTSHRPEVETLRNGLAGICAVSNNNVVNGVAIYADWDFSAEDQVTWSAWQE